MKVAEDLRSLLRPISELTLLPDNPRRGDVEALARSSLPGELIVDPFNGAGSTLLACEQQGRVGWGIELEPVYCDATIARWETLTGEKAERIETGS